MRNWILGGALVLPALVWTLTGDKLCLPSVSSKAQLALTGSFGFPPRLCLPAGEFVPLSGNVHVLSMAGVSGIGQTSGDLYIGVGTYKRARIAVAPGLNSFTTDFTLEPTDGCASVPLPVKFRLNFNRDGTLNAAASSVTLGGVT